MLSGFNSYCACQESLFVVELLYDNESDDYRGTANCNGLTIDVRFTFERDQTTDICYVYLESGTLGLEGDYRIRREIIREDCLPQKILERTQYDSEASIICRCFEAGWGTHELPDSNCGSVTISTEKAQHIPMPEVLCEYDTDKVVKCPQCHNCKCICECVCFTWTDEDGEFVGQGCFNCSSLSWQAVIVKSSTEEIEVSATIIKDDYLSGTSCGDSWWCKMVVESSLGTVIDPETALGCPHIGGAFEVDLGNYQTALLEVGCLECGECKAPEFPEAPTQECCAVNLPTTLIATFTEEPNPSNPCPCASGSIVLVYDPDDPDGDSTTGAWFGEGNWGCGTATLKLWCNPLFSFDCTEMNLTINLSCAPDEIISTPSSECSCDPVQMDFSYDLFTQPTQTCCPNGSPVPPLPIVLISITE